MSAATRVALLDDYPAVRVGFTAIVAREPDLQIAGVAGDEAELWRLSRHTCPDVLVLDMHHPGRGGLELCLRIRRGPEPPPVVLYTGATTAAVMAAAALAGAGAVVRKSAPTSMLLDSIRTLARMPATNLSVSWRIAREVAAGLDAADHAIFAMALAGHVAEDIGDTLGLPPSVVVDRIAAMIRRLRPVTGVG